MVLSIPQHTVGAHRSQIVVSIQKAYSANWKISNGAVYTTTAKCKLDRSWMCRLHHKHTARSRRSQMGFSIKHGESVNWLILDGTVYTTVQWEVADLESGN